jgi:DNA-binding CsgD family transcriptional regulator
MAGFPESVILPGGNEGTSHVHFTIRELSVLELVAEGCTNVQIAEKLHISRYTVAQHIAKMLVRIGAVNRTDLVSRAHVTGIL